ncbi:MAG TPA: glycosyltransferase family 9 protein [Chitinophagaceae bacterium]
MIKFLVIQTAFIGDVVLATAIIEKLRRFYPEAEIDFLVRKGNEGLLQGNPHLHEILIWEKKRNKLRNLGRLLLDIRGRKYDKVINLQRFASTGILTAFSGAKERIGFDKNPLSFFFDVKIKHRMDDGTHEVVRNLQLISHFTDPGMQFGPRLYPSAADTAAVEKYKRQKYCCIAPTSVWFTKQFPERQWIRLLDKLEKDMTVYLLGGPSDTASCDHIKTVTSHPKVISLAGQLSFLQSAALMQSAVMNYVNDSAPVHFASAMNAPVTAVFCSTIPAFGYGPLSDRSFVVETKKALSCRPCGLHGRKACPLGHFDCAYTITNEQLLAAIL